MSQSPPRTAAAALAAAGLLLVAFDGSAATGPRILQKSTPGEIEALAMDGSRIAYDVSAEYSPKRCNTVYVWNAARGTTTRVSGRQTCGADNTSTGAGVRELALAGSRVAWIVNQGGNSESGDYLYATRRAPGRARARVRLPHWRRQRHPHGQLARRPRRRGHVPCRQPLGDRLSWRAHDRQPGAGRRAADRSRTGRGDDDRPLDGWQAARGSAQRWNSRDLLDPGAVAADGRPELGERGGFARRLPRRPHEDVGARGLQLALRPATAHVACGRRGASRHQQRPGRV